MILDAAQTEQVLPYEEMTRALLAVVAASQRRRNQTISTMDTVKP